MTQRINGTKTGPGLSPSSVILERQTARRFVFFLKEVVHHTQRENNSNTLPVYTYLGVQKNVWVSKMWLYDPGQKFVSALKWPCQRNICDLNSLFCVVLLFNMIIWISPVHSVTGLKENVLRQKFTSCPNTILYCLLFLGTTVPQDYPIEDKLAVQIPIHPTLSLWHLHKTNGHEWVTLPSVCPLQGCCSYKQMYLYDCEVNK